MTNTHYFQRRSHLSLLRADTWQIESGVVRATAWLEDSATTLGFWGAGDIVSGGLLHQESCQLECLTPVTASPLHPENCPDLVLIDRIHQLQELLVIRSCKRIEGMLLKLLTWLGSRFGDDQETGVILKAFLTHQDLAETLNTSRVTITRTMNRLESQGTIRHLDNRRLFIARSAYSIEPVPPQLFKDFAHSSLVPIAERSLVLATANLRARDPKTTAHDMV